MVKQKLYSVTFFLMNSDPESFGSPGFRRTFVVQASSETIACEVATAMADRWNPSAVTRYVESCVQIDDEKNV